MIITVNGDFVTGDFVTRIYIVRYASGSFNKCVATETARLSPEGNLIAGTKDQMASVVVR